VSILVLTACICGCLSSGFFGFAVSSYFLPFLFWFARVNSMGVISLSSSESTGVMFAWNTNIFFPVFAGLWYPANNICIS